MDRWRYVLYMQCTLWNKNIKDWRTFLVSMIFFPVFFFAFYRSRVFNIYYALIWPVSVHEVHAKKTNTSFYSEIHLIENVFICILQRFYYLLISKTKYKCNESGILTFLGNWLFIYIYDEQWNEREWRPIEMNQISTESSISLARKIYSGNVICGPILNGGANIIFIRYLIIVLIVILKRNTIWIRLTIFINYSHFILISIFFWMFDSDWFEFSSGSNQVWNRAIIWHHIWNKFFICVWKSINFNFK